LTSAGGVQIFTVLKNGTDLPANSTRFAFETLGGQNALVGSEGSRTAHEATEERLVIKEKRFNKAEEKEDPRLT